MDTILERIQAFFSHLDDGSRNQLIAISALILLTMGGVGYWSTQTPYQPLLTNRTYDELLEAAAALEANEIPYRLGDRGSIDVPLSRLGEAKSAVNDSKTGPNLGDVGDLKLGLTPKAQEWAFIRAREGDVAKMLGGIKGVSAAQVNIVPRQDSLFLDDERPASASVFLRMEPGASLSKSQVRAMVNLVANAVDGLDSEKVSITNNQGQLLAEGVGEKSTDSAPAEIMELRTRLEQSYLQAVRQALLPVLGRTTDFSIAAIVDLDFTSTDIISKHIDVEKQGVLSELMDESASESNSNTAGGSPGVDANLPQRTGKAKGKGKKQNSEHTASTVNYIYPTKDEVTHRPAGALQRINIAVQVNEKRLIELVGEEAADLKDLKKRITLAVETAVGYNNERGDNVNVSYLPFAEIEWVEPEAASIFSMLPFETFVPYAVAIVALMLTFGTVIRPLMTNILAQEAAKRELEKLEVEAATAIKKKEAGIVEPEPEEAPEETRDDLAERLHKLVQNFEHVDASDLNELVQKHANAAAQVVRMWNRSA